MGWLGLRLRSSYLHTVIVLISHDDSSLTVARNPRRTIELTGPGAQRAKLVVESAARLEYLEGGRDLLSC